MKESVTKDQIKGKVHGEIKGSMRETWRNDNHLDVESEGWGPKDRRKGSKKGRTNKKGLSINRPAVLGIPLGVRVHQDDETARDRN